MDILSHTCEPTGTHHTHHQSNRHFFVPKTKALSGGRRATRRHLGAQLDSASPRLLRRRKGTKSVGMAGTTTSVENAIWEKPPGFEAFFVVQVFFLEVGTFCDLFCWELLYDVVGMFHFNSFHTMRGCHV